MIPQRIQEIINRLKDQAEYYERANNYASNSKNYPKEKTIWWEDAITLEELLK